MLQWWLEQRWGEIFKFLGCTLAHGHQKDGTSCAFTTINILAHEAVGEPLWNFSQRTAYRIRAFNNLIKAGSFKDSVVKPLYSEKQRLTTLSQKIGPAPVTPLESAKMDVDVNYTQENESRDSYLMNEYTPLDSGSNIPHIFGPATNTPLSPNTWCSSLALEDRQTDEEQINEHKLSAAGALGNGYNDDKSDTKLGNVRHPFFGIQVAHAKKQLEGIGKGKKRVVDDLDYGGEKKRHKPTQAESMLLVGINKSSINSRKLNEQVNAGVFEPNPKKMQNFRAKILELDPKAEFSLTDIRVVRHFKCGEEKIMKEPYNIANFKTHIQSCKGSKKSQKRPGGGMSTINSMMNTWVKNQSFYDRQ